MKTILIPTNFTDVARHATDYAIRLYHGQLKRIILLNAFEQPRTGRSIQFSLLEILRKNSEKGLIEDKLRIEEEFPGSGIDIVLKATQGDLSSSIKSVLVDTQVDLIVMGSKGDEEFLDMIVESVTARVIRNVEHPMLIVPPVADITKLNTIALATDLKKITNEGILKEMKDLCVQPGAKVEVFHVSKGIPNENPENEKMLSALLGEISHSFSYRHNTNIHSGIYKFIVEKDADIVTMIRRRGAGNLIDRLFQQSVSRRIAKNVRQTMLLLNDVNY